jgi:hypothetical protein
VGFVKRIAAANAAPTPSSINFSVAATSGTGSLLVAVGFGNQAGTVSSITDSQSNTYALDFAVNVTTTSGRGLEIWRCASLKPLTTSDTITVNVSATQDHGISVIVDQFSFLGTPDVTNFNYNASSGNSNSVSLTATGSDVLVYSALHSNGQSTSFSAGGSFTTSGSSINAGSDPTVTLACAYDASVSAGTVTASWSWTTSHSNVASIAAYPVGAAGAPGKVPVIPRRRVVRYRPRAKLGDAGTASAGLGIQSFPLTGPTVPVTVTAVPGSFSGNVTLVQQVSGTSTFDYGLATVNMTCTQDNTLIVLAGWDLSTAQTSAPMPAVYVTDSADNYWYHVVTSSSGVAGSRSACWYCPNARPITWLSVSLSTFASSLAYTVLEMGNLPNTFALDVSATNANGSAMSLTMNPGTTATADIAFTMMASSSTSLNVTPPAGWNQLATVQSGASNPNPVTIFPYWRAVPSSTSLSTTFGLDRAAALSGITVGISTVSPPPPQPNPNFPVLKVEAGFGFVPGDPSQAPPTWTDITSRVISGAGSPQIDITYGRQYELATPEAGEMTISMDNHDGAFTPGNTASPYYPNVILGTPVRVSAFWQGFWYYVGYGYVERWPQEWPDLPQWGISKLVATDAYGVLTSVTMTAALDSDILLDAPYVFIQAQEQYTTFTNGINPFFTSSDAQGFLASNTSRVNQRAAMYVDGTAAPAETGASTQMLGDADSGFGTSSISTAPAVSASGPGIIYTDMNTPDPLSVNGVTVEFWVVISAAATAASLQPVVFSAYGPPSAYFTANPSLSVKINNFGGGNTLTVTLADGSAVSAPFSINANSQQILLSVTSSSLAIYVNGALQTSVSLTAAQVTHWTAVVLGCANYAYQAGSLAIGDFTAFDLAIYPYQLPLQRVLSHYVTGFSGQQNVDATTRLAQVLSWSNVGFARAGQVLFNGVFDGVTQGPAYDYAGRTAADAINQLAINHNSLVSVAPSGAIVYTHRWGLYNQSPAITFGDSPAPASTETPYLQATMWDYDNTYLYNVVEVSQQYAANTTVTVTAKNFPSQAAYFTRSALTETIQTMSGLDVYDLANWQINKYGQPALRVGQLVVDPASNPVQFTAILQVQQGQAASVIRRPVGGAVISTPVLVQQISHSIGPASWRFSCQLSPYVPEVAVLQLDSASFDVLGGNTLG